MSGTGMNRRAAISIGMHASHLATTSKFLALLLACAWLSACGDKPANAPQESDVDAAALPKPAQSNGPITGMPAKPGPGDVPLSGQPPPAPTPEAGQVDLLNPETGALPGAAGNAQDGANPGAQGEPTPQDAVAVIGDYYASIDARSYARAYAMWSDGGRASGQTPQQFAGGYAHTAHVAVATGTPGDEDAGAGQRYLQVPVTITATQDDGSVRRYAGSFTLHRTVVDGASAEQRAWRIASADLRVVTP
jgi:hypothetical protein